MLSSHEVIDAACVFSILGCVLALYQILCHLRNYTEPVFQRYIIRIIFMVPVYAIGSLCSLRFRDHSIYFDTLRDCYEAWIIYNFSSLLLAYVGGPGAVVVKAEGKQVHPSWGHMTCCLPTMQVDGFFLRRCKQGTLQFVLLKPIMALLTVILYASGAYTEGDMSPDNGYFYISIVYNVSYTFALYGLLLFWIGASELLQPFNPLLKFILVKAVVFLTFWQGIGISYINSMGEFTDPEEGEALQNFMICVEMALAGTGLLFAFPHKEYQIGGSTAGFRLDAFTHAISIRDVVADTIHVFAPSYSDYVLYTDGGPADNVKRKKYRGQKGAVSEHPKAGLIKNMEKGVMADEGDEPQGRRSKTPIGSDNRKMEAHRKQAILLDSDSDGIESDDGGDAQLGTEVAAGSDDEVYHQYGRTRMTATRESVSDDEEQQQASSTSSSSRTSRRFRSMNSKNSRRTLEVVDAVRETETICQDEAIRTVNSSESTEQRKSRSTRQSGIGSLPLPCSTSKPLAASLVITAAQIRLLLGGPILSDDGDDSDSYPGLSTEPSLNNMGLGTAAAAAADDPVSGGPQHHTPSDNGSIQEEAASAVKVRNPAAAIMQHVSSRAMAAAGRILGAAQAAAAGLPAGDATSHGNYTAVLPALQPPSRTNVSKPADRSTPSKHSSSVQAAAAAAADWEPAFSNREGERADGHQRQRQHEQSAAGVLHGGGWAEEGWSAVQL